jgi:hypothetical protein
MVLNLAKSFGLTPADRHNLIRDHVMRYDPEALFGPAPVLTAEATAKAPASPSSSQSMLGLLRRLDGPGPGKPN